MYDCRKKFPYKSNIFDLVISINTLHNLNISDLQNTLRECQRVGKNSYIVVESFRNEKELFNLQCWALTCKTFFQQKIGFGYLICVNTVEITNLFILSKIMKCKLEPELRATISKYKIKDHKLSKLLIIRATELLVKLSKLGKIRGPLHTSVGQEAVAVSVCSNMKPSDALFSNHRGHGHYLAKDGNLSELILELMGDKRGCCIGYGGSMHVADLKKNIIGSNGIVGAGVPIACGYSLGQTFKTRNSVTVVFFGDGAINQGVVMESMNMAAIYNLPILFVCENNFYAYSTKSADVTKTSIYQRAKGFGIDSFKINGMNFKESLTKSKKAINNVRNYKKPVFQNLKLTDSKDIFQMNNQKK